MSGIGGGDTFSSNGRPPTASDFFRKTYMAVVSGMPRARYNSSLCVFSSVLMRTLKLTPERELHVVLFVGRSITRDINCPLLDFV